MAGTSKNYDNNVTSEMGARCLSKERNRSDIMGMRNGWRLVGNQVGEIHRRGALQGNIMNSKKTTEPCVEIYKARKSTSSSRSTKPKEGLQSPDNDNEYFVKRLNSIYKDYCDGIFTIKYTNEKLYNLSDEFQGYISKQEVLHIRPMTSDGIPKSEFELFNSMKHMRREIEQEAYGYHTISDTKSFFKIIQDIEHERRAKRITDEDVREILSSVNREIKTFTDQMEKDLVEMRTKAEIFTNIYEEEWCDSHPQYSQSYFIRESAKIKHCFINGDNEAKSRIINLTKVFLKFVSDLSFCYLDLYYYVHE